MNIEEIQDDIKMLENDATTLDNVLELASLYIVAEHLQNNTQRTVGSELEDLFPAYNKYVQTKEQYQRGNAQEDAIINALILLSQEIREFLEILYSSTNLYKERRILHGLIEQISAFYKD